jgi:peroxiredoxin
VANSLTGDFDVVAEFSIAAANRVLAAMHRNERFFHSLTFRVQDTAPGPGGVHFPVIGSVTAIGNATANQTLVGTPVPLSGQAAGSARYAALGAIANASGVGNATTPVVPSNLQGVAQLQVSPPTVTIVDNAGTTAAVQMQIMSRYFPNSGTTALAEFIRGELQLTAPVNQIAAQTPNSNVIELGLQADTIGINFTPAWSSQPVSASDLAAINLVIRNALKASFLPSSVTLPSSIAHMQFKALGGAQSAIAVLLNMQGSAGNPASMNSVLLSGADQFAVAVSSDFIQKTFQPIVTKILATPLNPITVSKTILWVTLSATYTLTLNNVTLSLQAGKIVLTITGHAHTPASWAPDFDFTVAQDITLQASGDTAYMVFGNMSFNSSSWIVNLVKGTVTSGIAQARDQALASSNAQVQVESTLSAGTILGPFMNSLLGQWKRGIILIPGDTLAYTSVDIQPAGITMHGSLAVTAWPAVDVEFEKIPANTSTQGPGAVSGVAFSGPDYSALNSWIPGGTIHEFDWNALGQTQPFWVDENKFVYVPPPPDVEEALISSRSPAAAGVVSGYQSVCLTVRGTRLSASGPVVSQDVSGTGCGFTWHPIVNGTTMGEQADQPPLVALAQPGPNGAIQVTGHTLAGVDASGRNTPNLIVHFADDKTVGNLRELTAALQASKRTDAATAVLAIVPHGQLEKTPYAEGVIYAEEQNGAWARLFRLSSARAPVTFLLSPTGETLWLQQGAIDGAALAGSLSKLLVAGKPMQLNILRTQTRIGQMPPNFLYEYTAGHVVTLQKMLGKQAALVFWKSTSSASIQALLNFQKIAQRTDAPLVFAINDGEDPALARRVADENRLTSILVTDPRREISAAYGVKVWPTTFFIGESGAVEAIRYGLFSLNSVRSGDSKGAKVSQ